MTPYLEIFIDSSSVQPRQVPSSLKLILSTYFIVPLSLYPPQTIILPFRIDPKIIFTKWPRMTPRMTTYQQNLTFLWSCWVLFAIVYHHNTQLISIYFLRWSHLVTRVDHYGQQWPHQISDWSLKLFPSSLNHRECKFQRCQDMFDHWNRHTWRFCLKMGKWQAQGEQGSTEQELSWPWSGSRFYKISWYWSDSMF